MGKAKRDVVVDCCATVVPSTYTQPAKCYSHQMLSVKLLKDTPCILNY